MVQLMAYVVLYLHLSTFHPLEPSNRPYKPLNHFWNISQKYRFARHNKHKKPIKWSNVVEQLVGVGVYLLHLSSFYPLEPSDRPHKPPNDFPRPIKEYTAVMWHTSANHITFVRIIIPKFQFKPQSSETHYTKIGVPILMN